jgi:hypothetical protein
VIEPALPFLDPLVFIEIVAVEPAQIRAIAINKMAASKPFKVYPRYFATSFRPLSNSRATDQL